MQKSKKPRENQKNKKNKKKNAIFQKSGDRVNRQESWNIVFFGFLEVFWIFAFLLLQESWNIVFFSFFVFFGFLEVFWKFGEVKEKLFFGNFAKLKKHLSFAKIQKSQDYAYILEYFWNFRKTPLFAIYPFLLYWIAHIIICLSFVFMY